MKVLDLILCHKWYDMTLSGEKEEEYRDINQHWCRRICRYGNARRAGYHNICNYNCNCQTPSCKNNVPTDITHVRLHRGYTNITLIKEVEQIRRGIGNPEWGATGRETFIIKYKPNNQ